MHTPLTERCRGRWSAILSQIGIDRSFLSGKHGPCPLCGGRDRWRWVNRNGSGDWICNSCSHGSGIDLVKLFLKVDFKEAAKRIEAVIGSAELERPKPKLADWKARRGMREMWQHSRPCQSTGLENVYFLSRGIVLEGFPSCLRFTEAALYERDIRYPAIVAKVLSPKNEAVQLHRTFLSQNGTKADVETPRKLMPGTLPAGSAVRLAREAPVMGVAEGIESALAASMLFNVPTWAALNAGNLEKFVEPPGVRHLMIFADNDASYTGHAAAYALARSVVRRGCQASVEIPAEVGTDWNDVLMTFHVERSAAE